MGGADAPSITMPGASKPRAHYYNDYDDASHNDQQNERDTDTPKTAANKKQEAKAKEENGKESKGKGGGWLGGILTKLSLRPPNQMILPDDKNPSIVWDPETKRWRNLDGDSDQLDQPPPPPPRSADLPHLMQSASPPLPPAAPALGAPPAAPVSNIFKMQKGRHIKKSYVDVLNPRSAGAAGAGAGAGPGAAGSGAPPAAPPPPAGPPAPPATYFVPAPAPTQQPNNLDGELEPRPEAIELMIPSSPSPSNSETPPPSPIPDPDPNEIGMYEPSMLESDTEPYQHSGI